MATIDDVAVMARELPGVTEDERHGNRTWLDPGLDAEEAVDAAVWAPSYQDLTARDWPH